MIAATPTAAQTQNPTANALSVGMPCGVEFAVMIERKRATRAHVLGVS